MRSICFAFLLQLLFIGAFSQPGSKARNLKTITVSGNGYQRGLQHGQQLKKDIAEVLVLWKDDLQSSMKMPADSFIQQFMSGTNFLPAIKKYTPDLLEEVKGIAVGSGQSFNDILAYQLVDEYWVYQDKLSNDPSHHHCSGIGVPAMNGQPALIAQNMDLESWMDGYQVVMHILPNGNTPEQFVFTSAGLIGLNGLNEHGIGTCVNTLMQLNASGDGLPVAFIIRGILAQKKSKNAVDFVQHTKHASGQNYILGTVDSVYDFEASGSRVVRMQPDLSGAVYHTNHPVVNDDIKSWYTSYYQDYLAGKTQNDNSELRFAAVKFRVTRADVKDDQLIKSTLRSKDNLENPVCRAHLPNHAGFTFGSVIYTLSGKLTMQVTAGPPDESEYQSFYFKK
ncbi:C45 family autoproteolytic acyltransferase/hydolase [Flavihumibacter profundi]|jgi:isopenicillin-N N-acyltransferase like protein|uniref:C45 family autoproteolytic acyltransferase/hydolase n=1 Tax=Flavihumibacter profundi TaxID=2716883 RepID=UPI001CC36512|nr:C45 family peptidase [Flavihumibacter profundi]MBZ5858342.1 C45 family peptidase [Flavihumibacter profundi]